MKIIALSGWKGSGKDTVADYLVKNGYTKLSFAKVLKDMVAEQYNIPRDWLDNPAFKEKPLEQYPVEAKDQFAHTVTKFMLKEFASKDGIKGIKYWTPRSLAILEGSVKRSVNSDYWVEKVISEVDKYSKIVISDLRYNSEVEKLRQAFGDRLLTCRINRFDTSPSSDPSERDLDDHKFDSQINNIGTLEELYNLTEMILLNR